MKKDELDNWFEEQRDCWDLVSPQEGHQGRFLKKLKEQKSSSKTSVFIHTLWKPLSIAASVVLIVVMVLNSTKESEAKELANVSPEMEQTQDFFTQAIEQELYNIRQQRTPATQSLINDALTQLQVLENDYEKLKKDLVKSGEDKRVIHGMITNFQARIDLLIHVQEEIENINNLKTNDYEEQLL